MTDETLTKQERLCGKKAVEALFGRGKSGTKGCLRYRFLMRESEELPSRILVSVPKRSFKRAVKRNLLKRRIREAYRRQKALLGPGMDVLFVYLCCRRPISMPIWRPCCRRLVAVKWKWLIIK